MHSSISLRIVWLVLLMALLSTACSNDDPPIEPETTVENEAPATEIAAEPQPAEESVQPAIQEELPQVIVLNDLPNLITWLESEGWWGPIPEQGQITVPHVMITAIHPTWKEASANIPVQQKKELFYRLMLPLVMHANKMVRAFRADLENAQDEFSSRGRISDELLATLKRAAFLLPGATEEDAEAITADHPDMINMIDSLLYRLDEVPAGLALGQAAYESGYGTSRFATEGNSLFGQWTYKGDGLKPKEQRRETKGDYSIKAFEWPFDSVRGYFINLMTHPAYEDFRRLRAEMRAEGKPLDSMVLADGLVRYSERGQEYVDALKGIMRVNKLNRADNAVFRDEAMRFLVSEQNSGSVEETRAEIERMRKSGELARIIERMRLE